VSARGCAARPAQTVCLTPAVAPRRARAGGHTAGPHFARFITLLVEHQVLVAGDFLVLDNCAIHTSAEVFPALMAVLDAAHVRFVLLPKYSPELNPCELVFAEIKRKLGYARTPALGWEVVRAASRVSLHNMLEYYNKCIFHV